MRMATESQANNNKITRKQNRRTHTITDIKKSLPDKQRQERARETDRLKQAPFDSTRINTKTHTCKLGEQFAMYVLWWHMDSVSM